MSKLTVRPLDFVIFTLLIALGIFLTVHGSTKKGSRIKVSANGTTYEYSAEKNGTYSVQGELGPTTFEIKDGRVRITDSPCPNKTCINQRWHSPLVCLPNKVIITVENEGAFDAISE